MSLFGVEILILKQRFSLNDFKLKTAPIKGLFFIYQRFNAIVSKS